MVTRRLVSMARAAIGKQPQRYYEMAQAVSLLEARAGELLIDSPPALSCREHWIAANTSVCDHSTETITRLAMAQHILIVDDDRQIARLVAAYLEQAGFRTLTAYDGATALRLLQSERPDLVVLDLMLPDADGADITRALRGDAKFAALPIIMLTARVEDADRIVGLELGADDYITKPFNPREVVARVRAVLRRAGGIVAPPTILAAGELRLDLDRHEAQVAGEALNLTPTEFDLLHLFMQQPGHAFTRQELIDHGLGYQYEGLERTIDSHIKNLRRKVESVTAGLKIETVYGVGYRLTITTAKGAS